MESLLGIQTACLVSGTYLALDHGRVCAWVVRRWAEKKPNEPPSWNWPGNLCYGLFPGSVGLVPAQKGEQETATTRSFETGGE